MGNRKMVNDIISRHNKVVVEKKQDNGQAREKIRLAGESRGRLIAEGLVEEIKSMNFRDRRIFMDGYATAMREAMDKLNSEGAPPPRT